MTRTRTKTLRHFAPLLSLVASAVEFLPRKDSKGNPAYLWWPETSPETSPLTAAARWALTELVD